MANKKLIDATKRNTIQRPFCVPTLLDFDAAVKDLDKQTLMARSRHSYSNNPLVRSVIQQKSIFTTKGGWNYKSLVDDPEWRKAAEEYFEKWARVACVNGLDFHSLIYQMCVTIDRDGDFFAILTSSQDGTYPQLQVIPSHRVATRGNVEVIADGKYKGFKVKSGVIVNRFGRPVAYNVLGDTESDDSIIDAINVIHIFDPEYSEANRGIPLVSHTLEELDRLEASKKAELTAQEMYSKTALIEHLDAIDDDSQLVLGHTGCGTSAATSVPLYEEFNDGAITVYRGQGSKLEALETNRPSMQYQAFRDKIIQEIVVSLNWSVSLLDGNDSSSVENRINLRVAELTVCDRIELLTPHIKRILFYVLSKAIKNGDLPVIENYWKMKFTKPAYITSDISKDANSTRENYKLGLTTLADIVEPMGKDLEEFLVEKYTSQALDIKVRERVEQQFGVKLSPVESQL